MDALTSVLLFALWAFIAVEVMFVLPAAVVLACVRVHEKVQQRAPKSKHKEPG